MKVKRKWIKNGKKETKNGKKREKLQKDYIDSCKHRGRISIGEAQKTMRTFCGRASESIEVFDKFTKGHSKKAIRHKERHSEGFGMGSTRYYLDTVVSECGWPGVQMSLTGGLQNDEGYFSLDFEYSGETIFGKVLSKFVGSISPRSEKGASINLSGLSELADKYHSTMKGISNKANNFVWWLWHPEQTIRDIKEKEILKINDKRVERTACHAFNDLLYKNGLELPYVKEVFL